jgi:hypothetical protein
MARRPNIRQAAAPEPDLAEVFASLPKAGLDRVSSRGRYAKSAALANAVIDVLNEHDDLSFSTRQLYYALVSRGVIPNDKKAYKKAQRLLVEMRLDETIPMDRIVDRTRAKHHLQGWDSAKETLEALALQFRRDHWSNHAAAVHIGCEKEALEGIFSEAVDQYGVALYTTRGYPSLGFVHEWAEQIRRCHCQEKKVFVYWFGDFDPSGNDIERQLKDRLVALGATRHGDIEWCRKGLNAHDFVTFDLVRIPVKRSDARARAFLAEHGDMAAELDALSPAELRRRLVSCIERHIDRDEWNRIQRAQQAERESLATIAARWPKAVNE